MSLSLSIISESHRTFAKRVLAQHPGAFCSQDVQDWKTFKIYLIREEDPMSHKINFFLLNIPRTIIERSDVRK